MRLTYSPISSDEVSGTVMNISPLSRSTILSLCCVSETSIHRPPTRLAPRAGLDADIVSGSTVAHDGAAGRARDEENRRRPHARDMAVRFSMTFKQKKR